jgi:cytidylate kinase
MWKNINFERCFSYISSHAALEGQQRPQVRPCITISRECGAGGRTVASRLSEYLQSRVPVPGKWAVFDKNLIEKVLEDHRLSKQIAQFVPEGHKSMVEDTLEDLLGLHPPTATLVRQTVETIWDLAERGNVILVGRGGNVVAAKLETAFHVRLVGSVERRIQRLIEVYDFDFTSAREFLKMQDANKRRYLKDYFGKNIDDPLLYHLIINTDLISYENAAMMIGDAVMERFKLAPALKAMAA